MAIHYGQRAALALTTAALAVSLAACSDDGPGDTADGAAATAGQGAPADNEGAQRRRAGRNEGVVVLGDLNKPKGAKDLGAPFDPCGLTWADFPAEVRPTDGKPRQPTARAPEKEDPFALRCLYDNSGKIVINADGTGGGTDGGYFMVSVVWGEKLETDASQRAGSTTKTFGQRTGLVHPQPPDKNGKACVAIVALSKGAAGVSVTNGRFPAADPCTVAETVATAIVAKAQ